MSKGTNALCSPNSGAKLRREMGENVCFQYEVCKKVLQVFKICR